MDKLDVSENLALCAMFDDYIQERTDLIAYLKTQVLPYVKNTDDKVSIMYTIGRLTKDLGYVRASAFSFVNNVYSKNSDFSFWLEGVS